MCGVVAYSGPAGDRDVFQCLCCQSCVRGVHSFGIAWHDRQGLHVHKGTDFAGVMAAVPQPLPCKIVFHNRYCTSGDWTDNTNNQPLLAHGGALAFNGTIDMGTKEEMERRHGVRLELYNDGELVLLDIAAGDPLRHIRDGKATFAGVFLGEDGRMFALRNELRPLWLFRTALGKFITSTSDIASRAKLDGSGAILKPFDICTL